MGALRNLAAAGERLEMCWGSAMSVCPDPHLLCDETALFSSRDTPEHAESRVSVLQPAVIWATVLGRLTGRCCSSC